MLTRTVFLGRVVCGPKYIRSRRAPLFQIQKRRLTMIFDPDDEDIDLEPDPVI